MLRRMLVARCNLPSRCCGSCAKPPLLFDVGEPGAPHPRSQSHPFPTERVHRVAAQRRDAHNADGWSKSAASRAKETSPHSGSGQIRRPAVKQPGPA